jgi:hypothetical protein
MTKEEKRKVRGVIKGLLAIAKIAMPDSYYDSDSRVRRAKKFLKEYAP